MITSNYSRRGIRYPPRAPPSWVRPGRAVNWQVPATAYNYSLMAHPDAPDPDAPLAVLTSGGLDSAVLLAEACRRHGAVFPLYVRFGLTWEAVEQRYLARFLQAIA